MSEFEMVSESELQAVEGGAFTSGYQAFGAGALAGLIMCYSPFYGTAALGVALWEAIP